MLYIAYCCLNDADDVKIVDLFGRHGAAVILKFMRTMFNGLH